jgi:hypothetical protein
MTSAILQYCVDHDSKGLEYLTENLYTMLGPVYTKSTKGSLIRTNGLRITVYDNKHRARRFEIIPSNDLREFNIYESNIGGIRTTADKPLGSLKADAFVTNNRIDHRKLINSA